VASILITCTPATGHVYPLLTVARHLVAQGHDVRMLTGTSFGDAVTAAGVEFIPMPPEADIDLDRSNEIFPQRAAMKPIPQVRFSIIECFLKPAAGQIQAIDAAIAERPVDLVMTEMMCFGTAALARRPRDQRPPIVTLGIFPLAAVDPDVAPYGLGVRPMRGPVGRLRNRVLRLVAGRLFAPVVKEAEQVFAGAGVVLPPGFDMFDMPSHTDALLQFSVPGFEYPRRTLSPSVRFIGPMTRSAPKDAPLPPWWADLDGERPVVHVSQGTVANTDYRELIRPTLDALAGEDVLVIVSTGHRPVESLGVLPANARAAEYLPYDLLFPKLAAFVTNGGYGGLQFALQHGVPIVAAGTSEDKLETTARVEWSGAGIGLATNHPSEAVLRRAVRRVLDNDAYRESAERLAAEIAASPGMAGVDATVAELTDAGSASRAA